jgi:LCP family protein required for cell wall assembly
VYIPDVTRRSSVARRAVVVVGIVGLAVAGWTTARIWLAWGEVDRVAFAPDEARSALEAATTSPPTTAGAVPTTEAPVAASTPDAAMDVFLIIGSDERSADVTSRRADVIMVFILPADGSPPVLTSIPRDLYLANPCTGGHDRVNVNLNGCGTTANGPEQVAVVVEDFTGLSVDHFVLFTFEGFRRIVDRIGGIEICPTTAVRDPKVDPVPLDLPAGCSIADGDQALAWVRSRHTLGLIAGNWVPLATTDLDRNQRQQDLVIEVLGRLQGLNDVSELSALIEELAASFTIDEGLSLSSAVSAAWSLKSLDMTEIARPVLPVAFSADTFGRSVLIAQATFESIVVAANPDLAQYFGQDE